MIYIVTFVVFHVFRAPRRRRRFAGAERGSRVLQGGLNPSFGRVRATEHAPGGLFRALERRHGLVEIVERGAVVFEESHRVNPPTMLRLAESEGACDAFYEAVVVRRVESEGVYHDRVRRGCNLCAALRGEACRVEGVN